MVAFRKQYGTTDAVNTNTVLDKNRNVTGSGVAHTYVKFAVLTRSANGCG